jgi:hypothetical protein
MEKKSTLGIAAVLTLVIGAFYDLASTPSPVPTLVLSIVIEAASVAIGARGLRAAPTSWRVVFALQILVAGVVLIDASGRLLLHGSLLGLLLEGRP